MNTPRLLPRSAALALLALACTGLTPLAGIAADGPAASCPKQTCPHSGGAAEVARWATDTYSGPYRGHYIGGGSVRHAGQRRCAGEARCYDEGTFGVDYDPWWSRVGLYWTHGRRYQSGHGQYDTDRRNNGFPNLHRR